MFQNQVAKVLFNRLCAMNEPTAIHNRWLAIHFDYFPNPVYLCRTSTRHTLTGKPARVDVTLGASYQGVLDMVSGNCDADGLFFQRQFYYQGNTELGLALKTWLSDLSYQLMIKK